MNTKIIFLVIALIVVISGSVVVFGGAKEAAGNSEFRSGTVGKSHGRSW